MSGANALEKIAEEGFSPSVGGGYRFHQGRRNRGGDIAPAGSS